MPTILPAIAALIILGQPVGPPACVLPNPLCPTGQGDDATVFTTTPPDTLVVPDHRPVARIAAWNGNWANHPRGLADWYRTSTAMSVPVPGGSGNVCIPAGVYNLVERMKVCYDRGFRRVNIMLPAGMAFEGQDLMPSSQFGPMPGSYRAAYLSYVKPWLDTKSADPVSLGIYAGFEFDAGSCSLAMEGTHPPDLTVEADAVLMKENIQPWLDIGIGEYWMDASSGSPSIFQYLYNATEYAGVHFGGEAVPGEDPAGGAACEWRPIASSMERAPWVCTIDFVESRYKRYDYDIWTETGVDPADTEIGVWIWHTPVNAEMCLDDPTTMTVGKARMLHELGWVLWATEGYTTTGVDYPFQTSLEWVQRVYDFGIVSAGADFNADGRINLADLLAAQSAIALNEGHPNPGYLDGDIDNDGDVDEDDGTAFQGLYEDFTVQSLVTPLDLGDHP